MRPDIDPGATMISSPGEGGGDDSQAAAANAAPPARSEPLLPLVIRVENLQSGTAFVRAFRASPVRIGRSELNDLVIAEPFVSQWHAVVQFDHERTWYVDLGSLNGSLIGGKRAEKNVPVLLGQGAEVVIGCLRVVFTRQADASQATSSSPHVTLFSMKAHGRAGAAAPSEPAIPARPPTGSLRVDAGERAAAALESSARELDGLHQRWVDATAQLRKGIEGVLAPLDPAVRERAVQLLRQRYPDLEALVASRSGDLRDEALRLIGSFAGAYLSKSEPFASAPALERFVDRIAEVLETFARSFVELRKGYEEFGKQMGMHTEGLGTALHRSRDPRQVLAYLLQPGANGQRTSELQSGFADLMIHQVALLGAVVEGARAVLARLSPESIGTEVDAATSKLARGVKPLHDAARWRAFETRFHDLADEETSLSAALFGAEFARAYSTIAGNRRDDGSNGDEGDGDN